MAGANLNHKAALGEVQYAITTILFECKGLKAQGDIDRVEMARTHEAVSIVVFDIIRNDSMISKSAVLINKLKSALK